MCETEAISLLSDSLLSSLEVGLKLSGQVENTTLGFKELASVEPQGETVVFNQEQRISGITDQILVPF
jgi:hypothetical protein